MDFLKRAWAEINLDNAKENYKTIEMSAKDRRIMPVIKADAYGHGANFLAKLYEECGTEIFAVSNINEAIKLRKAGITKDILILGYTPKEYIETLLEYSITQTVYSLDYAKELSKIVSKTNVLVKAHLKLDTGMNRLGFNPEKDYSDILKALALPGIYFEGIFTHYAVADSEDSSDKDFSLEQLDGFNNTVAKLSSDGYSFKYIHCCNSAATLLHPFDEGNLVRPGIILYGIAPADDLSLKHELLPVMSIKTVVSAIKNINKGETVSYGRTFTATKDMKIATLPIGYGDGYPRKMSNCGKVLINGKFADIVGRVCMDQMMIDITDIPKVSVGTEVTVIGQSGDNSITFAEIADMVDTIPYELVCNISVRVPRVYKKDGKIIAFKYLGGAI